MKLSKKTKKILKVLGAIAITLLIAINLFMMNLKPYVAQRIIEYNEKAVLFEYKPKIYNNITIPDDITLYFVYGVDSIESDILDLWFNKENKITKGLYSLILKEIKILGDREEEEIESILRHELAHHYYHTNLTSIEKKEVKTSYEEACINDREFYAETIEDYGYFDYER